MEISLNERATVYLVDDDDQLRESIAESIELAGAHDIKTFDHVAPVLDLLGRDFYGAVVSDVRLPGQDGISLLAAVMEIDPELPVILITGHGDIPLAVNAMRLGAYDFIEKPFSANDLASTLARAIERRRLVLENRALRKELRSRTGLETQVVGRSPQMVALRNATQAIAATDADVLIHGETGSGKEVISRAIHMESQRRAGPFIALNCGALPAEMIESELFGHEQGAFTGAVRQRVGKLESARGGTVLLDEIESMPIGLQVKLLRVIETRSIERLGSNKTIGLDIRFLAATKIDLKTASEAGKFRQDLYYRLNVVSLAIPSLRERKEDIPYLFHFLAREARVRYGRDIPEIPHRLMDRLVAYDWPGNVRELRNVVDRWVLNVPLGPEFESDAPAPSVEAPPTDMGARPLPQSTADFERSMIVRALIDAGSNVTSAAATLGLTRKTLYDKMHRYGINPRDPAGAAAAVR